LSYNSDLGADCYVSFLIVGSPPQCSSWVGQCGLYILVMIIEKIVMTGLIQF